MRFLGEPNIFWRVALPRVPFVLAGAGGRLMRIWSVNMNSSLSVAILDGQWVCEGEGDGQLEFLVDFGFFLVEEFEGCSDAMQAIVQCT